MLQAESLSGNPSDILVPERHHASPSTQTSSTTGKKPKGYGLSTPRQVTMITIGSAINTGLMIGAGSALSRAGVGFFYLETRSLVLILAASLRYYSYTFVGIVVFLVLCALGEVASWSSEPSTVAGHAGRYCDPALGFTLGWIYWLKFIVVIPNQLTAGTLILSYWTESKCETSVAWITTSWALIVAINYWGSRYFGKSEFILSSFKMILVLGLVVLSLILTMGGGPDRNRRGFRYWDVPGAFANENDNSPMGILRAIFRSAPPAILSYLGSERLGMAILHTQNPRKVAGRAIKLNFYRILFANIVTVTLLGMVIPYDEKTLAFAKNASKRAAAPGFVVAVRMAHIYLLPDFLNACFLLFVLAAAVRALCMATRMVYELSLERNAPAFLRRTNKKGVPIYALGVTAIPASLAYLSISKDSAILFSYFVNVVTMFSLLTWVSILIVHLSFVRSRKALAASRKDIPFRAPLGVFGSLLALAACILMSAMRLVELIDHKFYTDGLDRYAFITSYLGIPLYLMLILGYKAAMRRTRHRQKTEPQSQQDAQSPHELSIEREFRDEQSPNAVGMIWEDRIIPVWLV